MCSFERCKVRDYVRQKSPQSFNVDTIVSQIHASIYFYVSSGNRMCALVACF